MAATIRTDGADRLARAEPRAANHAAAPAGYDLGAPEPAPEHEAPERHRDVRVLEQMGSSSEVRRRGGRERASNERRIGEARRTPRGRTPR